MEIDFCRNDIITCLNNIDEWVKPEKVGSASIRDFNPGVLYN